MANDVILLSDSAFFVKTIDLPSGVAARDFDDFVDTALENFSPLPFDKTRRGFTVKESKITVFAAFADKLFDGLDSEKLKAAALVLPPLAIFLMGNLHEGFSALKSDKSVSLVFSQNGVAENFWTVPFDGDFESDFADLLASTKSEGFQIPSDFASVPVFKIGQAKVSGRKFKFTLEAADNSKKEFSLPLKSAQFADVRLKNRNESALKKQRTDGIVLWAYKLVAVAFALLLCGQYYAWSLNSSVVKLSARLGQIQPRATEIEKLSEESARLSAFTSKKIHSVEILAKFNKMRPDDISFVRVAVNSPVEVEIFGKAPSLAVAGDFAKKLRSMAEVADVQSATERVANGAKFSLKIKLRK